MSLPAPNGDSAAPVKHQPTCPKCGRELDQFSDAHVTFKNGFQAYMLWCPNPDCRALFGVQVIGLSAPKNRVAPAIAVPPPGWNPTRKQ